jgi:hypothetical protein
VLASGMLKKTKRSWALTLGMYCIGRRRNAWLWSQVFTGGDQKVLAVPSLGLIDALVALAAPIFFVTMPL